MNPIARAADERIEALRLTAVSTRAERLPDMNFSCGITKSDSMTDPAAGNSSRSKLQNSNCGVSISGAIYDGHANRYRHEAAKANTAAVAASFNTNDKLVGNTRGALADEIMDTYALLLQGRARMNFFMYKRSLLETTSALGKSEKLKEAFQTTNQTINQMRSNLELFELRYQYLVKVAAAKNLESLDNTIAKLRIPLSVDDAIAIAKESSPEIKRRAFGVQQAEFSLKALKAGMGPNLSFRADITSNQRRNELNALNSNSAFTKSVGVTLNIPLGDRAKKSAAKSSEALLRSRLEDKEAADAKTEFELKASYLKLTNEKNNYVTANEKYLAFKTEVDSTIQKIKSGKTKGLKLDMVLDKQQELQKQFIDAQAAQNTILDRLLTIYQVTGLLFTQFINSTGN